MRRVQLCSGGFFLLLSVSMILCAVIPAAAIEKGDVTGAIERKNDKFLRDYETLDYKGEKEWAKWGKGLKSQGWIVVQGDSGELKDYLLLVVDTNTEIEKKGGGQGVFSDLEPGERLDASYRMGWDALHAQKIVILSE